MLASEIVPGGDYAYVEYPKAFLHPSAQPNPIRVRIVDVEGDRVRMARVDGRSFLVGNVMVPEHTVPARKIVCAWDDLTDEPYPTQPVEEILQYFDGIEMRGRAPLEARLRLALVHQGKLSVTLESEEIVAIGRRIRELQNIVAQNALVGDEGGWE